MHHTFALGHFFLILKEIILSSDSNVEHPDLVGAHWNLPIQNIIGHKKKLSSWGLKIVQLNFYFPLIFQLLVLHILYSHMKLTLELRCHDLNFGEATLIHFMRYHFTHHLFAIKQFTHHFAGKWCIHIILQQLLLMMITLFMVKMENLLLF